MLSGVVAGEDEDVVEEDEDVVEEGGASWTIMWRSPRRNFGDAVSPPVQHDGLVERWEGRWRGCGPS